jgi:AAA+ superfamily predicted ATPase
MENHHGLVVNALITQATGIAEREAMVTMASAFKGHIV